MMAFLIKKARDNLKNSRLQVILSTPFLTFIINSNHCWTVYNRRSFDSRLVQEPSENPKKFILTVKVNLTASLNLKH